MNGIPQSARSVAANWFGNGPWRSKSVLAALAAVVAGLGLWVSDIRTNAPATPSLDPPNPSTADSHWNWGKPFPGYVRVGISYVAAYCIGWLFRRLLRLILVGSALVIALLAYGKFAGWDMTHTREKIKRSGEWAQREVTTTKDYLTGLLPSATAAGIGMFLGFRRRNSTGISIPAA